MRGFRCGTVAPPEDISMAVNSFDCCTGHPDPVNVGTDHDHTETAAITSDDSNLVGMMKDGYFVYGRRDVDGRMPSDLDRT